MTDVVDIRNLWSAFRRGGVDTVIHKNLNLRIEEGELLALVGGSGTGKTVLLRQMLGLEAPQRGTVTVLGEPAEALTRRLDDGIVGTRNARRCGQPGWHVVPAWCAVFGLHRAGEHCLPVARVEDPSR